MQSMALFMPGIYKKLMERKDQRWPIEQQNARMHSRNEDEENRRGSMQDRNRLQEQEQPLKNNDRDVDPENPRESSLSHR